MNKKPLKKSKPMQNRKPIKKKSRKKATLMKRRLIFKRLSLVALCLFVVFSVLWGICFLLSKIFSIKNISIQGDSGYSDSEVISASGLDTGSDMLFLNSKDVESKIYMSFPNIDEVKVSKKFPNKLVISLESATPAYYLETENEYLVISSKNKLLMRALDLPEGIVGIVGLEADIKKTGKIEYKNAELEHLVEEILNLFKDKGIENINEVDISDLQNITLMYDNRIRINIGNSDDMDYKILTVKEIINDKISKTEKGTLNLKDLKTENRTYFTSE